MSTTFVAPCSQISKTLFFLVPSPKKTKMPPLPSQKGTGKKGRDPRQSRSRNTTPSLIGSSSSLPQTESGHTAFLELPIHHFQTDDDIIDNYSSSVPNSRELEALVERLN